MRVFASRWHLTGPTALCLQLLSAPARGEPAAASDPADPELLFQAGVRELLASHYDVACPLLEKSYAKDPRPGVLFTLAECESGWKHLASALSHYQSFAAELDAAPPERRERFEARRQIAVHQIAALQVSTPSVKLVVLNEQTGTVLSIDDRVVDRSQFGVEQRADPGAHTVSASVAGKRVWERTLRLDVGDHATVNVVLPPPASRGDAAPAPRAEPLAHSEAPSMIAAQPSSDAPRPDRSWFYVAGGAAIVGVTTGAISGALALSHKPSIDEHCPSLRCDASGRASLDASRTEATLSTIGFSVGIAGAAAAALLFLFEPSHDSAAATSRRSTSATNAFRVSSDGNSVALGGIF